MEKVSVEKMLNGEESRYPLVVAVAKRARDITDDYLDQGIVMEEKAVNLAIEEFKDHKFDIVQSA